MSGESRANRKAAESAISDLIRSLGLDPARDPELQGSPSRIADFYFEAFSGLDPGAEPDLVTFPHTGEGQLVLVRDLAFHSMCVHHFAPFFGRALIAYLPDQKLIGVSGLPRLLELYSRRPQVQERLGEQIASHLERLVAPRGVAVVLEARHLCMEMRGIRKRGRMETRVVRGALAAPEWAHALQLEPRGR